MYLKKLLGITTMVGLIFVTGCSTKQTDTVMNDTKEEEKVVQEVAADCMSDERLQGEGFSIGVPKGWHEAQFSEEMPSREGFLTLKHDEDEDKGITVHQEAGPAETNIDELVKQFKEQLEDPTFEECIVEKGKAPCGDYIYTQLKVKKVTEEDLKEIFESQSITQEMVDAQGGNEVFLEMINKNLNSSQIYVPYENGKMINIAIGIKEGEESETKELMEALVKSLEIGDTNKASETIEVAEKLITIPNCEQIKNK